MDDSNVYGPEPEWKEVFKDPAVLRLTSYCPPNTSKPHGADEDERLIRNMDEQAEWFERILDRAMADGQ
jgi:hypothetical protein